jgi:hypothetical protein
VDHVIKKTGSSAVDRNENKKIKGKAIPVTGRGNP